MVQSLRLYHFLCSNEGVWISGIRDSSLVHNIFCNKIAEKYGGGGHKGAAGFRLEDMPFKKI